MELEVMKKLIRKYEPGHTKFSFNAMQAERYYRNETDILINKIRDERKEDSEELPRTYCQSKGCIYVYSTATF